MDKESAPELEVILIPGYLEQNGRVINDVTKTTEDETISLDVGYRLSARARLSATGWTAEVERAANRFVE